MIHIGFIGGAGRRLMLRAWMGVVVLVLLVAGELQAGEVRPDASVGTPESRVGNTEGSNMPHLGRDNVAGDDLRGADSSVGGEIRSTSWPSRRSRVSLMDFQSRSRYDFDFVMFGQDRRYANAGQAGATTPEVEAEPCPGDENDATTAAAAGLGLPVWKKSDSASLAAREFPWAFFLADLVSPEACAFAVAARNDSLVTKADRIGVASATEAGASRLGLSPHGSLIDIITEARSLAMRASSVRAHLLFDFVRSRQLVDEGALIGGSVAMLQLAQNGGEHETGGSQKHGGATKSTRAGEDGSSTAGGGAGGGGNPVSGSGEDEYEGAELLDTPEMPKPLRDAAEAETAVLFDKSSEGDDKTGETAKQETTEERVMSRVNKGDMRSKYRDAFPDYFRESIIEQDNAKWMPPVPKRHAEIDALRLEETSHSTHIATAAKLYAGDVSKRAITIMLEEQVTVGAAVGTGTSVQSRTETTMFIGDIIKLFAAPFVAVLYTPVGQPLGRGVGGGNKMAIAQPAGLGFAAIIFFLVAFPVGMIMGIIVSNILTEGLTFMITWQVTYGVAKRVPKMIIDGVVARVNDYLFFAATPSFRDVIKNLLIDVLSDTISNSLHHTLVKSLTERLSSSLTPATTHYYYCVYCYYYGDYCDICYKVSDYDILHRQWTIGAAGERATFDSSAID